MRSAQAAFYTAVFVALLAGCESEDVGSSYAADTLEDGVAATKEFLGIRGAGEDRTRAILSTFTNPKLQSLAPCKAAIEFDYVYQGRAETGVSMLRADSAGAWTVEYLFPL